MRFATRIGLRKARPGQPGSGFRQRFAARAIERLVRQIAAEAGTTRLALRVRPTNDVHQVVVAFPWRNRTRAQALGRAVAEVLDSLLSPDLEELVSHAAESVRASEPGPGPTTLRPRVPIVAVTGTNGKTTTSRMVAHIARTHGLHVGWSSTDGIYVDGELVEPGDYSGPSGRRPGAGPQAGAARGHRDRARRHPAQGHRADPQRRVGVHQRLRGPPRAARHRHARPARRGQGRRAPDHQGLRLGGAERRRPAGLRDAHRRSRPSRGCSPATPTPRRSGRRCPTAAARPPSSTAGSRCCTPTATPTRWSRSSTSR